MAASRRRARISFYPVRRTKQAANDRRACIIWIKRLVKKQVEKQMAEVYSEVLFMNRVLREEMEAELQELNRLLVEETRERPLHHTKLYRDYRMSSRRPRRMEEEYNESTDEDEDEDEDEDKDERKRKQEGSLKVSVVLSSSSDTNDCFISDNETNDVSSDAKSKTNHSFSLAVAPVCDNSQSMKESVEEGSTRNLCYVNPSFIEEDEERPCGNRTKEEEALETVEGKHGQEGNRRNNVKLADKEKTKEQGEALERKEKQTMTAVKKMKTYVSDFFHPHPFSRWERLEDED